MFESRHRTLYWPPSPLAVDILPIEKLDRAGKVLLSKPNMEFRERYEIATNPGQYFDESEVAMQRLSADVSRDLVSAILDQF